MGHNRVAVKDGNHWTIKDLSTGATVGYIYDEKVVSVIPTGDGFFGTDAKGVGYQYDDRGVFIRNIY